MSLKSIIAIVSATALTLVLGKQSIADNDWGYEGEPATSQGISAPTAQALGSKYWESNVVPSGLKQNKRDSQLPTKALPPAGGTSNHSQAAIQDWIKLYSFVGSSGMTVEQQKQLTDALTAKLKTQEAKQVTDILEFWPRVESVTAASPEQKENYKILLRALLRLQSRTPSANSTESSLIGEVLGPLRIAADGKPPLTEEAIDAYADMACFLYEQNHPGKTVDATDNRMVFASVIRNKFIAAPTQKDRDAMANFDLTWARFKILWTGANSNNKQKLVAAWATNAATTGGALINDPTLDSVLHAGPWARRQ